MSLKKQLIFYKGGRLRFVGHLDMMRTMQRAMTRAGIPLAYSQGFNPHAHMSFCSPLALGCVGEREIMEIRLEKEMSCRDILNNLNAQLPEGLHIHAVRDLEEISVPIMAQVKWNEYRIVFPEDMNSEDAVNSLLQGESIMVTKYGKVHGQKKLIQVDLKPLVYSIRWENPHCMDMICAGGSETNLKPELFLGRVYEQMQCPERQHEESISRTSVYGQSEEGALINLSDYSEWECRE